MEYVKTRQRIEQKVVRLMAYHVTEAEQSIELQEPRTHGTIKLDHAPAAEYRYRVGNSRILFDIDDRNHIIEILDIRKRDEQTYK